MMSVYTAQTIGFCYDVRTNLWDFASIRWLKYTIYVVDTI